MKICVLLAVPVFALGACGGGSGGGANFCGFSTDAIQIDLSDDPSCSGCSTQSGSRAADSSLGTSALVTVTSSSSSGQVIRVTSTDADDFSADLSPGFYFRDESGDVELTLRVYRDGQEIAQGPFGVEDRSSEPFSSRTSVSEPFDAVEVTVSNGPGVLSSTVRIVEICANLAG